MKTWKKYVFIYFPIAVICLLINHFVKNDNTPSNIPYHLFFDFEKNEYDVKDWVTGEILGTISFNLENDEIIFEINSKETDGELYVGEYKHPYKYSQIQLKNYKLKKYKIKNLEFFAGPVGDWYTALIISLDRNDYHDYYKSENKKRYLFYLEKNGDYNFSIKDESVYDLYSAFGACRDDMKYAAIFE